MKPRRLVPLLAACLALLACRALTPRGSPSPATAVAPLPSPTAAFTPAPSATATFVPTPVPPAALEEQSLDTRNDAQHYTVKASFPALPPGAPAAADFNRRVKALVEGVVADFEKNAAGASAFPADVPGSGLVLSYKALLNQGGLLSLKFEASTYIKGAAHPNLVSFPLNYDLRAAQSLALSDLFLPRSAYLALLSSACLGDLQKRDFPLFPEGAAPKIENFRSWNLTPGGLLVTFDAYQVAPYAAGPQEVTVPYARLRPLADPAGPLAGYLP